MKQELEAFEEYLISKRCRHDTIINYRLSVKQFLDLIKKLPNNITKNDISNFETYCTRYQNNSLTPKFYGLNKYLEFLVDRDILPKEALNWRLKAPKRKKILKQPLSHDQIEKIFQIAERNSMHKAMFMTFYYGMLRNRELRNLNINDINFEKKIINVINGKGGKDATINIHSRCLEALKDYIEYHREEPKKGSEEAVFLNGYGSRISRSMVHVIHQIYKQMAGFDDKVRFHPHNWRTTGITHYAEKETDIKILMAQTRHSSPEVLVNDYIHKTKEECKKSYEDAFGDIPKNPVKPQEKSDEKQNLPEDVAFTVPSDEYKQFLEWKKQQDMMYQ